MPGKAARIPCSRAPVNRFPMGDRATALRNRALLRQRTCWSQTHARLSCINRHRPAAGRRCHGDGLDQRSTRRAPPWCRRRPSAPKGPKGVGRHHPEDRQVPTVSVEKARRQRAINFHIQPLARVCDAGQGDMIFPLPEPMRTALDAAGGLGEEGEAGGGGDRPSRPSRSRSRPMRPPPA
ncbi:unnamed protein product [Acanthosepion pharaonis]|uniref:Uncharacterized protein n=1 Tax=Acanthosepion pharaonis TaxID=158019 RepID=A0A812DUS8_ACAPH|nr:unnamed protein product [Sepia pharaonis]